ncbi:MAG: class I SAM-dependent methyltransferase [bacterium]|nr:class I SAM-dependent methyltransferase [bacterium]
MNCFICKKSKLFKFLSLGHQPPSDAFLPAEALQKPEATFPLDLLLCEDCSLIQLGYTVDPKILFAEDYAYNSGTNKVLREHFKDFIDKLVSKYKLSEKDLAVDIGSNDGSLLENYALHKVKILGIDPSGVTKLALQKGQPTIVDFFNETTAKAAVKKYGEAKIITATNVFAHVDDLHSFMRGITYLLAPDGVFVSESGYTHDMVEGLQYDFVYHEHLRYYTLKPLTVLFEMFGMEVIDAERVPIHGGSIRVHAGFKGKHPVSPAVQKILAEEKKSGLYDKKTYLDFAKKVEKTKLSLQKILMDIKTVDHRIVGIGAPAKGNTLLNYCKIDSQIVSYLVETSERKIGQFTPGMHIQVVEESQLFKDQPEYALLLSWTIAPILMKKLREKGYKGKFILPAPKPVILDF